MKKFNISLIYPAMPRIKGMLRNIAIVLLATLSSACQMAERDLDPITKNIHTMEMQEESIKYSQYYLMLKGLTIEQLLQERDKQISLANTKSSEVSVNQAKLILLYSLPEPKINQPYKAKSLLNDHLLLTNEIGKDNLAFIMLLRDQLNIQLRLLEKQVRITKEHTQQDNEKTNTINQLNEELIIINKQLILLKEIDKNINERD